MGFFERHKIDGGPDAHELQDIYYAEHQITKALPKLAEKATNRDLKQALKSHLEGDNRLAPGSEDTGVGCFNGTGGGSWRGGSLHESSSLKPGCG